MAVVLTPNQRRNVGSRTRARVQMHEAGTHAQTLASRTIDTPLGQMLAVADNSGLRLLDFTDRRGLPRQLERMRARLHAEITPAHHPHLITVEHELARYFAGTGWLGHADEPLGVSLSPGLGPSPFQREVWNQLLAIPLGQTRSYAAQAQAVGRPGAVRAVARANGENFLSLVIPCHRVIGADGSLTGYGGGLARKRWLLDHEARMAGPALFPHGA